jgi:hypothetical protein
VRSTTPVSARTRDVAAGEPAADDEDAAAGVESGRSPVRPRLAFGVLVDAFIIRMTVVPAVMTLLGKRAWWMPKRLGRVLPEVDIEGQKLATA